MKLLMCTYEASCRARMSSLWDFSESDAKLCALLVVIEPLSICSADGYCSNLLLVSQIGPEAQNSH